MSLIRNLAISARNVRCYSECVAKLFAALRSRNNRIRLDGTLNQCCALAFVIESILLVLVVKIVLQHIHSNSGHLRGRSGLSANCQSGHSVSAMSALPPESGHYLPPLNAASGSRSGAFCLGATPSCPTKRNTRAELRTKAWRAALTFGVGRPIAPMRRTHVNACLDFHPDPAAKNTAARKSNCTHTIRINNCQFEIAVERCGRNWMPHKNKASVGPAQRRVSMTKSGLRRRFG